MKQKGVMEESAPTTTTTATEGNAGAAAPAKQPKQRLSIHLPKSKREVYDLFNLSRTNEILRGHSPAISPTLPGGVKMKKKKRKRDDGKRKAKKGRRQKPPSPESRDSIPRSMRNVHAVDEGCAKVFPHWWSTGRMIL